MPEALCRAYFLQKKRRVPKALRYVVLQVLLPKESLQLEQQQRDWREILAVLKPYLYLGSLKSVRAGVQHCLEYILVGRQTIWLFGLVAHAADYFYLAVPRKYSNG